MCWLCCSSWSRILVWTGVTLVLDAWWSRRPVYLADRLLPYQPGSVADQAQQWLNEHS
jgi:hypothetical protein